MDNATLKQKTLEIIKEKEQQIFFCNLYDNHLIDKHHLIKGLINHLFQAKIKGNNGHVSNTVIDIAIELNVTEATVKNTIYKYHKIRLKF